MEQSPTVAAGQRTPRGRIPALAPEGHPRVEPQELAQAQEGGGLEAWDRQRREDQDTSMYGPLQQAPRGAEGKGLPVPHHCPVHGELNIRCTHAKYFWILCAQAGLACPALLCRHRASFTA